MATATSRLKFLKVGHSSATQQTQIQTGNWWQRASFKPLVAIGFVSLLMAGCASVRDGDKTPSPTQPTAKLRAASFEELPGFSQDNLIEGLPALQASCRQLLRRGTQKPSVTSAGDWSEFCNGLQNAAITQSSATLAAHMRATLQPYEMMTDGNGLFTGYYEPLLRASTVRGGKYQAPIYKRPTNMVEVNLGDFRDSLKGQKVTGRVETTKNSVKLVPYYDRAAIAAGALPESNVLFWADDPVDVFFLEVQGSGRAEMVDGTTKRIGYAAQNGHGYTAIGKVLRDMGEIQSPVSMQKIRDWLTANPERRNEIFNHNPSHVFFRDMGSVDATGAPGLELTTERSLAIDPAFYSYHLPLWVGTTLPDGGAYNRLMVAQDTGGAIKGPVRGDIFFGFGTRATELAGQMQQAGRLFTMLPRGTNVTAQKN